jgi:hypothetical protein
LQAIERQAAREQREGRRVEREAMEAEERARDELFDRVQWLADATLVLAGYHRHKCKWRRRRTLLETGPRERQRTENREPVGDPGMPRRELADAAHSARVAIDPNGPRISAGASGVGSYVSR